MCVYYQNYALVVLTQPKIEELRIHFTRKTQCSFIIQVYKTIVFGLSRSGELKSKGVFLLYFRPLVGILGTPNQLWRPVPS